MGFIQEIKEKAFIACKRHCVLCEKDKGKKLECHHIVPKHLGGEDTFDNCIPICFDCHEEVGSYNAKHPKGNKYYDTELKSRRDNFYLRVENGIIPINNFNSNNLEFANRKTVNYPEIIEEDKKIIRFFISRFEDEDTIRLLNHDFHGKYPRVWRRPLDELSDFYILPSSKLEHRVLRELTKRIMKSVNELLILLHFKGFTSNDWINDDTYYIQDEDDMVLCNWICTGIWKEYKNLIKTYKEILYKLETHD